MPDDTQTKYPFEMTPEIAEAILDARKHGYSLGYNSGCWDESQKWSEALDIIRSTAELDHAICGNKSLQAEAKAFLSRKVS